MPELMDKIDKVSLAVADYFDIEYLELFSAKWFIEIETARRFVIYILNKHYNYSVNNLCWEFEKTDTSINFSINYVDNWIHTDEKAKKDYLYIISKLDNYEN